MNGPSWRAWLAAAAIFVLGVGVGGAGVAWAGIRVFRHALLNPAGSHTLADRATERVGADLNRALKLTPEESAQVHAILAQTAANLRGVRTQAAGQVSAEVRATVRKISAALPPEKRAEFRRLVARRYERLGLPAPDPEQTP